ncbi:hypothetical protein [Brevibacillus fluminis]|nr:hypothetical protein [Brevibacillus fluminis]
MLPKRVKRSHYSELAVIQMSLMAPRTIERERKKSLIKDFSQMLDQLQNSDDPKAVGLLITYLNSLLRVKDVTPPLSEIISILKWQKPTLFHHARLTLPSTSHLTMVFQIDLNPHVALKRLEQYVEK